MLTPRVNLGVFLLIKMKLSEAVASEETLNGERATEKTVALISWFKTSPFLRGKEFGGGNNPPPCLVTVPC
jgi:hypothetical protein